MTTDLHVPAATHNPMTAKSNQDQLPATRPTLELPVQTHTASQDRFHAGIVFLFMLAACLLGTFIHYLSTVDHYAVFTYYIILFYACYAVVGPWYFRVDKPEWWSLIIALAVGLSAYIASVVLQSYPVLTFGIVLTLLIWQAARYRKHYIFYAAAGSLDHITAHDVRQRSRFPDDVVPTYSLSGYLDTFVTWASYNRLDIDVPGVWQSPAGGYRYRMVMTCLLVGALTYACRGMPFSEYIPWISHSSYVAFLLYGPFSGLTFWLLAMSLAVSRIVGPAYALRMRHVNSEQWQPIVDRMQSSPDKIERNSIFLGTLDFDGSPIIVDVEEALPHIWVVGKDRSGRTRMVNSCLTQYGQRGDTSVVYVDLDALTFESLAGLQRVAARSARRTGREVPVKHFTLNAGQSSYLLNMFSHRWWHATATQQRASLILEALGLVFSTSDGRGWHTNSRFQLLHWVLDLHPDVRSWRELHKRLQDAVQHAKAFELSREVKRESEHLLLAIQRLAGLAAINPEEHSPEVIHNAIDFADAFLSPVHHYFALGAIPNSFIAGEVAGVIVASVLNAAYACQEQRKTRVALVIDAFAQMPSEQLALMLAQGSKLGLGVILVNETPAQLTTELLSLVESTSVQIFTHVCDNSGRELLRRLGGQHIIDLASRSYSTRDGATTYGVHETPAARLSGNLVDALGADPNRFVVRITENRGYACFGGLPIAAKTSFEQSRQEYKAACATRWPAPSAETLINGASARPEPSTAGNPFAGTPTPSQGHTRPLGKKRPPASNPKEAD